MMHRADAVQYALCWLGTPYVTGGRVLGAGCDCQTFVSAYLMGIRAAKEIPFYTYQQDWFCHRQSEWYFDELSKHATCTWQGKCVGRPPVQPGDIALFRVAGSKLYNHAGIVSDWPKTLHAFGKGVCESRPTLHPLTAYQDMAVFSPWARPQVSAR